MRSKFGALGTAAMTAGVVAVVFVGLAPACVADSSVAGDVAEAGADGTTEAGCVKMCGANCATGVDPLTGCGAVSCDPCPAAAHALAGCQGGACALSGCETGYGDCNPSVPGCETSTSADSANCGACGGVCGAANATSVACQAGACVFTCGASFAHCGTTSASGCETNIGTSRDNCGACGHSCLGGDCISGKCAPVLLAGDPTQDTGLKSLYGITILKNELFGTDWTRAAGAVYKLPISGVPIPDGGTRVPTFIVPAPGGVTASPIGTDGTDIFYIIFGGGGSIAQGIWKVHPDGTGNAPVLTASPDIASIGVFIADANYLYWTKLYANGIYRATPAGVGSQVFSAGIKITNIVSDGTGNLYFNDQTNGKILAASATTLDTPTELASSSVVSYLQIDANFVYWSDTTNNKLFRVKRIGGGVPQDLRPSGLGGSIVANFLADGKSLYFLSPSGDLNTANAQKLYVMPADGSSAPTVLATIGTDNVSSLTQDATAIYWTTYGRDPTPNAPPPYSAVYKVAK